MFGKKRGQSTLEYVVILIAIVAAIVAVTTAMVGNKADSGLGKLLKRAADNVETESAKIADFVQEK